MKNLVVYFSASGVTARLATKLAMHWGSDLHVICPKESYSEPDLNWHDPQSRSSLEMKDPTARPEFTCQVESMDQYEKILLGFPIWWYEAPRVIQSFLEAYDFTGKTIVPFATSGGSGMGKTVEILRKSAPTADWKEGGRLDPDISGPEMEDWLVSMGL